MTFYLITSETSQCRCGGPLVNRYKDEHFNLGEADLYLNILSHKCRKCGTEYANVRSKIMELEAAKWVAYIQEGIPFDEPMQ